MGYKLAIVFPTFSRNWALARMAIEYAKLWRKQCDDLIVCEDGSTVIPELATIATVYMYHENVGVGLNMVWGWRLALDRGADYVACMDSDCFPVEGTNFRDMCVPGKVTVPVIIEHPDTAYWAPVLCVPKEVSTERGMYPVNPHWRDDTFDTMYAKQIDDLVMQVKTVKVSHIGSATRGQDISIPFSNAPLWTPV